ncbi:hypothetical protein VTG60DRAFT_106 [Thermothelomyces hinnuleus]
MVEAAGAWLPVAKKKKQKDREREKERTRRGGKRNLSKGHLTGRYKSVNRERWTTLRPAKRYLSGMCTRDRRKKSGGAGRGKPSGTVSNLRLHRQSCARVQLGKSTRPYKEGQSREYLKTMDDGRCRATCSNHLKLSGGSTTLPVHTSWSWAASVGWS